MGLPNIQKDILMLFEAVYPIFQTGSFLETKAFFCCKNRGVIPGKKTEESQIVYFKNGKTSKQYQTNKTGDFPQTPVWTGPVVTLGKGSKNIPIFLRLCTYSDPPHIWDTICHCRPKNCFLRPNTGFLV